MLFGLLMSVFICLSVLVFSLPLKCWATVRMNCRRLDGSFSRRRLRREVSAFCQYLLTLSVPALLTFLMLFVFATLMFSYIIPSELIVRSFSEFDADTTAWRQNLDRVQLDHTLFLSRLGATPETIDSIQRTLWHDWPIIAVGGLVAVIAILVVLIKCAGHSVGRLAAGIRRRRRIYARTDVQRMRSISI